MFAVFLSPWKLIRDVVLMLSNFFKQLVILTAFIGLFGVKLFEWMFSLSFNLERDFDPWRFESLFLINSENNWQFRLSLFWVSINALSSLESLLFFIFSDPSNLLNDGSRIFFISLNLWGDLEDGETYDILLLLISFFYPRIGDRSLLTDSVLWWENSAVEILWFSPTKFFFESKLPIISLYWSVVSLILSLISSSTFFLIPKIKSLLL